MAQREHVEQGRGHEKAGTAAPEPAAPAPAEPVANRGHASVLFTAFEPSGDALAAPVIRELVRRVPQLRVYAWGGPKMEHAGATLLGRTTDDAAMGAGSLRRLRAVRREISRVKQWARQYRVLAHVPVDAPAANFPIAKAVKKSSGGGARIIHLVAPQVWAWGRWRINKLRRLTDLVLCILPFEEQWFKDRDIPAKFIGHPALNRPVDLNDLREQMHGLPQGAPRIAIFPGSRAQEVRANIRLLTSVFAELQGRHAGMAGIIVAANPKLAKIVRRKIRVFPSGLHMVTAGDEGGGASSSGAGRGAGGGAGGATGEAASGGDGGGSMVDAAIGWCDLALAVSGTVTLDLARQCKPMIGLYKTGLLTWLVSKVLLRAPLRLLPNIIADREIVPEFVPYWGGIGGSMPIVRQASTYLLDSKNAANQSAELQRVCMRFAGKKPAEEATRLIIQVMKDGLLQEKAESQKRLNAEAQKRGDAQQRQKGRGEQAQSR